MPASSALFGTLITDTVPEAEEPVTGSVITADDELYGRNVVLGARIAGCAHGGEIIVSSTLKEYTETDPNFRFEDRGERRFKGVLGEHNVYAVVR